MVPSCLQLVAMQRRERGGSFHSMVDGRGCPEAWRRGLIETGWINGYIQVAGEGEGVAISRGVEQISGTHSHVDIS